jgi:dTDP-glucose 4,6-dehydratase
VSKKIVYISGCLGFIGAYVTQACLDKGWHVFGIDKCTYASNISNLDRFKLYKNFRFDKKDICDLDRMFECDYFINTAAETHVGNSIARNDEFLSTNILGVSNILNLIRRSNIDTNNLPTFFHFSTDEVYGDIGIGSHSEDHLLMPSNPYSATKASADMLILAWARTYNIPYVILRPTNNYGLDQYVEKLIPKCCKYLQLGKKLQLHNNGLSQRTWLHAKDTANAVIKIIESESKNEIFNVSSQFELPNIEVCNKIVDIYFPNTKNKDHFYDFSYQRPGQDLRYSLDDSKLRSLGWKEEAVFDDEIAEIAKYYKGKFIW